MSAISLRNIIEVLKKYVNSRKKPLKIILIGGLALHYYGMQGRTTIDIDAEVTGDIEPLLKFLKRKNIPADLGEEIGRWSTINMPSGYKKRAITIYKEGRLMVKVLNPLDFIISKLRRFTEEDFEDALFVVNKYKLKQKDIESTAKRAIKSSPKDITILAFKKNLKYFLKKI
ncbi:hypothetical protein HZC34_05490 [Candidatus Saganbacteria bacterium]|nr:hypothetical protein [Candidatus Saganbacteria bacterium]